MDEIQNSSFKAGSFPYSVEFNASLQGHMSLNETFHRKIKTWWLWKPWAWISGFHFIQFCICVIVQRKCASQYVTLSYRNLETHHTSVPLNCHAGSWLNTLMWNHSIRLLWANPQNIPINWYCKCWCVSGCGPISLGGKVALVCS